MKKTTFLMLGLVLVLSQACAQSTAPKAATKAFSQKFPTAKKAKWDKENATEWEVEFKMNGKEYSANYTSEGVWKETEHKISKSKLPDAVKTTLNNEFKEYDIDEAEISETADGKVFEFALENDTNNLEVAISPEGKVVKKEVIKEDEKDND